MSRLIFAVLCLVFAQNACARDQIRVVGSSTVFPFITAAAEQFGKLGKFRTPIVESTGTGGGLQIFCSGTGEDTPDLSDASRAIKPGEIELCAQNGVKEITELRIGYDGIVFANALKGPTFAFNKHDIFLALAKEVPKGGKLVENFYTTWRQVNPAYPDTPIRVYGSPPTSGTRDAFSELVMEEGCKAIKEYETAYPNSDERKKHCMSLREDGTYIEAGENGNLVVQKLMADPEAIGVFGYSFMEQNAGVIKANAVDGTMPVFDDIVNGKYAVARSLYVYVKNAHVGKIPGLHEFVKLFTSDVAVGEEGFLVVKGLIPLPGDAHEAVKETARNLTPLGAKR